MDEKRVENLPACPQEVVLSYVAEPKEIVSYYISPSPLPRRGAEEKPAGAAAAEKKPRSHRGRNIFLLCMAALLVVSGGLTAAYFAGFFTVAPPQDRYEPWDPYSGGTQTASPTIERAPNVEGVKLRYREDHDEQLTIQQVYERVNPSTVTVVTELLEGGAAVGTGVIFTADGYVVTNAHVIAGGKSCFIALSTGAQYEAKLVGYDLEKDLAVIKVEAQGLPAAEFGDSDALTVGDTVYAIGNPLGVELRGTLTDGIVSAINRDVDVDGVMMTMIQTTAALNSGNSGGPLINCYGQVIGINTMKMGTNDYSAASVEGLGFAIPISSAAYMINDLIRYGEIHGEVVIGITVILESGVGPDGADALTVFSVEPEGPGALAGVQVGDLILAADGEAVATSTDLLRIRRRHEAGEELRLTLSRGGRIFEVGVVLQESAS